MSFEFAKKGLDVLLISRTKSKLDEVAAEIKAQCPGREVRVLAVDYSGGFDASKRSAVAKALDGLDVGVLANNVGMSCGDAARKARVAARRGASRWPRMDASRGRRRVCGGSGLDLVDAPRTSCVQMDAAGPDWIASARSSFDDPRRRRGGRRDPNPGTPSPSTTTS